MLERAARAVPSQRAFTLGDEGISYSQADARANRLANVLLSLGVRRGDRVMFWSPMSLRAMDVFFATQKLGAAFVPFKDVFSIREALPLVRYVRPRLVIADAALTDRARELADAAGVELRTLGGGGSEDLEPALARSGDDPPPVEVDEEDIHAIFLTSGSTGQPKGVMVSHRASWHRAHMGGARAQASGGTCDVNMFPLFHWAGWHFTLMPLAHLRTVHFTRKADAASLIGLIDRWHPGYMYGLPAIWERILDHRLPHETASLTHIMTGTYRFEPELVERLRARFPNAGIISGWGSTELGSGLMIGDQDISRKPFSVGLPSPGVELRIVDGEIRGRTDQMMSGYFDLPDETAAAVVDGWYVTGDLAERDEEGYYTITGRKKEVIRSGGETIAPPEVEAAILRHPAVLEAAVVGIPDTSWGEIVCAALRVGPGASLPSTAELRAHLTPLLAHYKHPRLVVSVDALPRTPATGQIQRTLVRNRIIEDLAG
jgi:acyl-CoA synthetase (AMP-forming)/AMP-acid ligase II